MGHHRRAFRRTLLPGLLVVGLLVTPRTLSAAANEVLTWNETALKAVAAGGQNPVQISRTLAMVQGAVHDALNAITRRYAAYYFEGTGNAGASPDAAVAAAAHTVLVGVLPSFGTPAQKVAALAIAEDAYKDITRAYTSFSQAARESADSRVYAGIHFPTACEDGLVLGRKIGERAVALYLQPVQK
jgi:hypothetical protein